MSDSKRVDLQLSTGKDRTSIYETDDIQIMRVRLAPGEALPTHNSNSNVLLVPVEGAVNLKTPECDETFAPGEAFSVPYDIQMDVSNASDSQTTFLVLKTQHPRNVG